MPLSVTGVAMGDDNDIAAAADVAWRLSRNLLLPVGTTLIGVNTGNVYEIKSAETVRTWHKRFPCDQALRSAGNTIFQSKCYILRWHNLSAVPDGHDDFSRWERFDDAYCKRCSDGCFYGVRDVVY